MDNNSTDNALAVENDEILAIENNNTVISVSENSSDVLSVQDNDSVISVSENSSDVLSVQDNDSVISVSENSSDVLSVQNTSSIISVSSDDLTSYSPFAQDPQMTQSSTRYTTVFVGKMTFLKKYKNMALYGYKLPSKKNKKAWQKHKNFQKALKKQTKLFIKSAAKKANKVKANHWHTIGDLYYKVKYSGRHIEIRFYVDCYRTYNYNPLLKKGWWD